MYKLIKVPSNNIVETKRNRKSKGKVTFIEKIKSFYYIWKYRVNGLEDFTNDQIDEFIKVLNDKDLKYNLSITDLIIKKAKLANKADAERALIDTVNAPQENVERRYQEIQNIYNYDAGKIDEKIEKMEKADKKNEKLLDIVMDEKIARTIDEEVANQPEMEQTEFSDVELEPLPIDELENVNEAGMPNVEAPAVETDHSFEEEIAKEVEKQMEEERAETVKEIIPEEVKVEVPEVKVEEPKDEMEIITDSHVSNLCNIFATVKNENESLLGNLHKQIEAETMKYGEALANELKQYALDCINKSKEIVNQERAKNEKLTNENKELTNNLDNANKTISDRDNEIANLKAELAKKNEEIVNKDKNISDLNNSVVEKDEKISNLESENKDYKTTVATLMRNNALDLKAELEQTEEVGARKL